MRRFYFVILALAILLQACSVNSPVDTPTPTATSTPTIRPTVTRTPTITPSPTIVRIPTWDPYQATATVPTLFILINGNTVTPFPTSTTPTAFDPGFGFGPVLVSERKIYWGSCKLNKTTISAEVKNPDDVYSVVIFVRVKALKKEDYTPWTTGDVMKNDGNGKFSYTLVGSNIEGHNHYKESWVFFQLVATDEAGAVIGRTPIYTDTISLFPCK